MLKADTCGEGAALLSWLGFSRQQPSSRHMARAYRHAYRSRFDGARGVTIRSRLHAISLLTSIPLNPLPDIERQSSTRRSSRSLGIFQLPRGTPSERAEREFARAFALRQLNRNEEADTVLKAGLQLKKTQLPILRTIGRLPNAPPAATIRGSPPK
jgi:hypothetical protein